MSDKTFSEDDVKSIVTSVYDAMRAMMKMASAEASCNETDFNQQVKNMFQATDEIKRITGWTQDELIAVYETNARKEPQD